MGSSSTSARHFSSTRACWRKSSPPPARRSARRWKWCGSIRNTASSSAAAGRSTPRPTSRAWSSRSPRSLPETPPASAVSSMKIAPSSHAWSRAWRRPSTAGRISLICGCSSCSRCSARISRSTLISAVSSATRASASHSRSSQNTSACRRSAARVCSRFSRSSNTNTASSTPSADAPP